MQVETIAPRRLALAGYNRNSKLSDGLIVVL